MLLNLTGLEALIGRQSSHVLFCILHTPDRYMFHEHVNRIKYEYK
jgi:hypothetical protein